MEELATGYRLIDAPIWHGPLCLLISYLPNDGFSMRASRGVAMTRRVGAHGKEAA